MLFQECLPPLRIIGNDKFGAQRQYHRYIVFFSKFDRLHGRFRHWLARLAAHQIGRQHQRGRSGNHRFRDAIRPQLVHMPWADCKGTLTGLANQRKAATNRSIYALQVVQIGTTGGIA